MNIGLTFNEALHVNNQIDVTEEETRIDGANAVINLLRDREERLRNVRVASVANATAILRSTLKALLESDQYKIAATLCWGTVLFDTRPRSVRLIWDRMQTNPQLLIFGAGSLGKCLGKGTRVLMFDGSVRVAEDIQVGDLLMGDDSTPRKVISLARGKDQMYRVRPRRGEAWTCTQDHILTLQCGIDKPNNGGKTFSRNYRKGLVKDIPLSQYINGSTSFREAYFQFSVGAEFPKSRQEFDPYIYGLWLGDGGVNNPVLHNQDQGIVDTWCNYFKSLGYFITVNSSASKTCHGYFARWIKQGGEWTPERIKARRQRVLESERRSQRRKTEGIAAVPFVPQQTNPFRQFVKGSFFDGEKRIRREYLIADRRQREKLLAGLIDTDGYSAESGVGITTKYVGLREDILFLARSLGFFASSRTKIARIKSIGYSCEVQVIYISGASVLRLPCLLKYKLPKARKMRTEPTRQGFKVEACGFDDYYGFTLDGNGRFLLGDFTVTHNSYTAIGFSLLDWERDPEFTTTKLVSTTAGHARAQSFSNLVRLHRMSAIPMSGYIKQGFIGLDKDDKRSSIAEVAIPPGDDGKARLQGFHPLPRPYPHPKFGNLTRVRGVFDEAEDIAAGLWKGEANMMQNLDDEMHVSIVAMWNPKNRESTAARKAEPVGGWSRLDPRLDEYTSREGYHCVRLDARRCENVIHRRMIYPGLQSYEGFRRLEEGPAAERDTFAYGLYPQETATFGIINASILDQCRGRFIWGPRLPYELSALDMAEEGEDEAYLTAAKYGLAIAFEREGGKMTRFDRPRWVVQIEQQFPLEKQNTILMGKDFININRRLGVTADWSALDCTSSVTLRDWIRIKWGEILGVKWGEGATDIPILEESREKASDLYTNVKTEMFFATANWSEFGYLAFAPSMDTTELFAQLAGMRYKRVSKTLKECERTKEFKKRFGGKSPDKAASCVMIIHLIRMRTGQIQSERPALDPASVKREGQGFTGDVQGEMSESSDAVDAIEYVF